MTIAIFLHVAEIGSRWQLIMDEILTTIENAGLPKPYINILNGSRIKEYEFPTLKVLYDYCKENPEDVVIYLHSKGVSQPAGSLYDNWRKWMLKYVVSEYSKCLELLKDNDTVGCNWIVGKPHSETCNTSGFWPGNFWMAKATYIRRLCDPITLNQNNRWEAEAWIGTGNPHHKDIHTIAAANSPTFCEALKTLNVSSTTSNITVITALSRPFNLPILQESLEKHNVNWVILSHLIPQADWFKGPIPSWAKIIITANWAVEPLYNKLNAWLNSYNFNEDQWYVFLNDDDLFIDNFWEPIKKAIKEENKLIIASMWHNPNEYLKACPENMVETRVGIEQLIIHGSILKNYRFQKAYSQADGELINRITNEHKTKYVPEAQVAFNCLRQIENVPSLWERAK